MQPFGGLVGMWHSHVCKTCFSTHDAAQQEVQPRVPHKGWMQGSLPSLPRARSHPACQHLHCQRRPYQD